MRLLIFQVLVLLSKVVNNTKIQFKQMLIQGHLPFLIVRYTHKDMDLCFSKVVDKLRKNDPETLDDDFVALQPSVSIINYVYDVRIWIYDPPKHMRPVKE